MGLSEAPPTGADAERAPMSAILCPPPSTRDSALAEIWPRYADRVRNFARSFGGVGVHEADDIVQETMLKVWRSADSFDADRGTEATFVFTIARRVIIDRWRKTKVRPPETNNHAWHEHMDPKAGDAYDDFALSTSLREALTLLTEPQREVIQLAYGAGLSQSEIAEEIGIPLGTVKTRTFTALRVLRRGLVDADVLT